LAQSVAIFAKPLPRAGIGVLEQMETPIAERDDRLVSIES